ncbi:coiled-coil domain-containing protein 181 isoform X2 [Erythrolamprus reginae]|uniref:coiled-coil domain-containing protein 181 isoform X2 n=1 Tax=Erythrolamprus reginae TaxID=121349 RepID=UPI00396CB556
MSDKKETSESTDTGDTTEGGDYEDDFEKDLEWLINEEEKEISDDIQNHDDNEEDFKTNTDKDLEDRKNPSQESLEPEEILKDEERNSSQEPPEPEEALNDVSQNEIHSIFELDPKSLEPASDTDSESSGQESRLEDKEDEDEEEDIKRYILEKIEEANKLLLGQEPLDESKERKLKFDDNIVELEVPGLTNTEVDKNDPNREQNIAGRLAQLRISNETGPEDIALSINGGMDDEHKDGKILVERDGKFELLSIRDIESQGLFPPLSISFSDIETQHVSSKSSYANAFGAKEESFLQIPITSCSPSKERYYFFPQPPPIRPSSAINITRNIERGRTPRRVQSAKVIIGVRSSTFCLSPRQKELRKQMEQRRERKRREEENQKKMLEDEKKKENDRVFHAWLQKKKTQMLQEKRVQRAKQMENLNSRENRNPEEAFKLWLKRKQQDQIKEKQIQTLKEQEEGMFFLPRTTENDKAYKQWLRRKRRERREEQHVARERSKQFRQEARRAKQIDNILHSISEPKSLRFTDQH